MQIKSLFDPTKNIFRAIEKVITYNTSAEERLKAEISEYIVTRSIETHFESLLSKMELAMSSGGQNEIGVWVSGFYGSGKSSFTKYLGLALDESVQIDGTRFLERLCNRFTGAQTKALLSTVATRYPAAVVLLDLASDMMAGNTMEEISTVLYYKVLQWAGYSRNLKVAAFERRLKRDGRYAEFLAAFEKDAGIEWSEAQNDPLVIDSLLPAIAHQLYPDIIKTNTSFNTDAGDFMVFESERVKEMVDIVREKSGKSHIVFIIDEVGQYVSSRPTLILNLDGLAKNLKQIGDGKVWIIGTAQQTLTEDDPTAALNSPELYKLKDRFPIQLELESSDIREICYRRLLGKSATGEQTLGALFDQHGQALRHHTKLENAKGYDVDFDRGTFTRLYPFLPAHFSILLNLLSVLAKSTGGIGLRSAIKVVQDVLVEGAEGNAAAAEQEVGWLATTVTLYDSLQKDIRRAAPAVHQAVERVTERYSNSSIHQAVAKTVAVLQIMDNLPVTAQNIAALMHPSVDAASQRDAVDVAIAELKADAFVPFGDKDGNLHFFSERIVDIQRERKEIALRVNDLRREQSQALTNVFSPLPQTTLNGALTVTAGLQTLQNEQTASLAGERNPIQLVVVLASPDAYDATRAQLTAELQERANQRRMYLLGRTVPEMQARLEEILRSKEIAQRHRNDTDQEIKDYCRTQADHAARMENDLQALFARQLRQGSFIFRSEATAVEGLDLDVSKAASKLLATVAEQVYERFGEAPHRAGTDLAEKLLRVPNLNSVSQSVDPLGLVRVVGGKPRVDVKHKALVSITDYLDRNATVEGKRLTEVFTDAPYGWSPDTLRYLVAALMWAGEIKLNVSGRWITTVAQQAIEALKTNVAFKNVGVALRSEKLPTEVLERAASRLQALIGAPVLPLEQEISQAVLKHFPELQRRYSSLDGRLSTLRIPVGDRARDLTDQIATILGGDGSDAPARLGGQDSQLAEDLAWARDVTNALNNNDFERTVRELQSYAEMAQGLSGSGVPGALKQELAPQLAGFVDKLKQQRFYDLAADFATTLTAVRTATRKRAQEMTAELERTKHESLARLQRHPDWGRLLPPDRSQALAIVEGVYFQVPDDQRALPDLMRQAYELQNRVQEAEIVIVKAASAVVPDPTVQRHQLTVPTVIRDREALNDLRARLDDIASKVEGSNDFEITVTWN